MTVKSPPTVTRIRDMQQRDMPQVYGIEAANFPYPWANEDFVRVLRQWNCRGVVAERRGQIVGYMVYEFHCNRSHILNMAVHAACHRQGIGRRLVEELHSRTGNRRRAIMLECRETNLEAHLFFRAIGFKAIAVLEDFYQDKPDEPAYLFRLKHGELATA